MTNSTLQVGTMVWLNTQGKEIRAQNKLGKIQTICTSDEMVAQHGQDFLYMVDEIRSLPIENSPLVYGIRMAGPWAVGTFQERDTLWVGHEQLSSLIRAGRTEAGQKLRALRDTRAMTACYNQSVRVPIAKGEILVSADKYACSAGNVVLARADGTRVTTMAVRSPGPYGQGVINPYIFEVVS